MTKTTLALVTGLMLLSAQAARADDTDEKVNALIEKLVNKNANVRKQAAVALGKMGKDARAAVPALIDRIGDGQLARIGVGITALTPIDESRHEAVLALSLIAPNEVVPALKKASEESPSQIVRVWAEKYYDTIQKSLKNKKSP